MYALGLKVIRCLCQENSTLKWNKAKLTARLFHKDEQPVFEWVDHHVKTHHTLPKLDTLVLAYPDIGNVEVIEPSSYYIRILENKYYYDLLSTANQQVYELLKEDPNAHDKAMHSMQVAVNEITGQKYRARIMDFGIEGPGEIIKAYHNLLKVENPAQFGWPHMDNMGGVMPGEVVSYVGRPAMGKAQPLTSKVLTTTGWKIMGGVVVGDVLASVDGQPSKVTGVFPQGPKPVYELTFSDGRKARASGDHLWEIKYRDWHTCKVETTMQLIARLKNKRYQNRLSVRLFEGEFGGPVKSMFSPYLLGVFLGDGCFRSVSPTFSSADKETVTRISEELLWNGLTVSHAGNYDYRVRDRAKTSQGNRLKEWFVELGVWGLKSEAKHIPVRFLEGDSRSRWQLLQGLMDTDGFAGTGGDVSYSTSSPTMAKQVQYLIRSLGGKSRIRVKPTKHLTNYIVSGIFADRSRVFTLERKRSRVSGVKTRHFNNQLTISCIEFVGVEDCQCISVSHPSSLYVTDDFVVTHNTFFVLNGALFNWKEGRNVLFVSMEMAPLPIAQRAAAMYAHTNLTQLKTGGYATYPIGSSLYEKFGKALTQITHEKAKMYIVDGNLAASAEDVYTLADQLECSIVVIDGAYLLRHKNGRLDRFMRAAENTELIKRFSSDLDCCTFTSWQFSREAIKKGKNKNEQAGLEDIGYTDAIGQISSIVLGLFQEDGVETMKRRSIKVLKGRDGQVGQFEVNWDFVTMDFSQIIKQVGGPLTFI